jgi:D-alanyl-lipoteichoic acid acyltransferase DltB (MBOAT superfamily)
MVALMLFNSWEFCVFFPIVTLIYFLLPHGLRWAHLLLASCLFYMSFVPEYILILAATIIVDYLAAIWMEKTDGSKRKMILVISVIVTCLILFFFKYFNFFAKNANHIARFIGWNYSVPMLEILLPIGLSFHTFQSLSYVIEVYRGQQKAERHFGIYALYVMFYPQLVAGPIERPQNLLHQFRERHNFDYKRMTDGLRLIGWGLFKKVVIADRLATFVNPVYDSPVGHEGLPLMLATLFFTIQIYCDFSGYSDIAIGTAKTMGFDLMKNFDRPYTAKTLSEFWKRWHISLSTWLRDYVYEPLALNLRHWGKVGVIAAFIVTFMISGFWHGAKWNFGIWGLLHGIGLSAGVFWAKPRKKLAKLLPVPIFNFLSIAFVFVFVSLSYVFFRAKDFGVAKYILGNMWRGHTEILEFYRKQPLSWTLKEQVPLNLNEFYICIGLMVFLMAIEFTQMRFKIEGVVSQRPWWVRWPVYYAFVISILFFGIWFDKRQFIYFQF